MKHQAIVYQLLRGTALGVLVLALGASVGCMTTYDAQGRPVQSVDPGMAVAGAAAAGLAGYAIANRNDHRHSHHYYRGGYYRGGHYRRAYYR